MHYLHYLYFLVIFYIFQLYKMSERKAPEESATKFRVGTVKKVLMEITGK